jgi:uncharacterized membrane protein
MTAEAKKRKGKGATALYVVLGIILILVGFIPVAGGAVILVFSRSEDSNGYHLSNTYQMNTSTYAFAMAMSPMQVESFYGRMAQSLFGEESTVEAEWVITPVNSSKAVFTGWAPHSASENYINTMEMELPTYWHWSGPYRPALTIQTTVISGQGLGGPASPAAQNFWLASAHSSSTFTLDFNPVWDSSRGNNYLIITNMDGSQGVAANLTLGYKIPIFNWLGYVLIPIGIFIFACGILLLRKKS